VAGKQTLWFNNNNRTSIHNYDTKSTIVIASISNDDKPKAFVGACAWQPRISLCFFLYYKKKSQPYRLDIITWVVTSV